MEIFDSSGVLMGDLNIELRQGPQPAAFPAREGDGPATHGIAVFHRAQNIRRVAGTADRDHDIARLRNSSPFYLAEGLDFAPDDVRLRIRRAAKRVVERGLANDTAFAFGRP